MKGCHKHIPMIGLNSRGSSNLAQSQPHMACLPLGHSQHSRQCNCLNPHHTLPLQTRVPRPHCKLGLMQHQMHKTRLFRHRGDLSSNLLQACKWPLVFTARQLRLMSN